MYYVLNHLVSTISTIAQFLKSTSIIMAIEVIIVPGKAENSHSCSKIQTFSSSRNNTNIFLIPVMCSGAPYINSYPG